ncbi:MAG: hypothetical protein ACE5GO_03245, partial [Anaerolineales bacterium]
MLRKYAKPFLIAVPFSLFLFVAILAFLPPVRTRLDLWAAEIQYKLNPPEEVVFVPQEQQDQVAAMVSATLQVMLAPSQTPTVTQQVQQDRQSPTPTPEGPTPTPTVTP